MLIGLKRRVIAVITTVGLLTGAGLAIASTTSGAASPPTSGGYFQVTAPGTPFPTDAACAAQVHHSTWEPRPENNTANHTVPPAGFLTNTNPDWSATWNNTYRTRITGNFTGTTDEIIQWAACKWGWSDELVRGEAIDESNWQMSSTGDSSGTQSNCFPGYNAPCPTSFGFLQIKWYYNPSKTIAGNSMPYARDDTAFSIDYALSQLRGCYDGMSTFLNGGSGKTTGDLWNCIGSWFSGDWASSGSKSYQSRVQGFVNAKAWLGWADKGGGTTPPTTIAPVTTVPVPPTTVKPPTTTTKPPTTTTTTKPPVVTTTTTQPPPPTPPGPQTVWACVNDAGTIESTRMGLIPQKCAHLTDRRIKLTGVF